MSRPLTPAERQWRNRYLKDPHNDAVVETVIVSRRLIDWLAKNGAMTREEAADPNQRAITLGWILEDNADRRWDDLAEQRASRSLQVDMGE